MSLSTIAAARQNDMKASMAVVATNTRGAPDVLFCCDDPAKSIFISRPEITERASRVPSSFVTGRRGNFYTLADLKPGTHHPHTTT